MPGNITGREAEIKVECRLEVVFTSVQKCVAHGSPRGYWARGALTFVWMTRIEKLLAFEEFRVAGSIE